jgi:hypothetical protein
LDLATRNGIMMVFHIKHFMEAEVIHDFRQGRPKVQILFLPSDSPTAEAGQSGVDWVNRLQSLFGT